CADHGAEADLRTAVLRDHAVAWGERHVGRIDFTEHLPPLGIADREALTAILRPIAGFRRRYAPAGRGRVLARLLSGLRQRRDLLLDAGDLAWVVASLPPGQLLPFRLDRDVAIPGIGMVREDLQMLAAAGVQLFEEARHLSRVVTAGSHEMGTERIGL